MIKKFIEFLYSKREQQYFYLIIILLVIFTLLLYFPVFKYNYLVPPGDDPYNHLNELKILQSEGFKIGSTYPLGFHWIVLIFSKVTSFSIIESMIYIYPALLVASTGAIWLLAYLFIGKLDSLVILVLYIFLARQPLQTLYDGGFPNILAGSLTLPILMIFLLKIFSSKKFKIIYGLMYLLTFLAIILTHHLTTLFALAINVCLIPILVYVSVLKEKKKSHFIAFGISILVFILLVLFLLLVKNLLIFSSSESLTSSFLVINNSYPFLHLIGALDNTGAIYHNISEYSQGLGPIVLLFGILGIYFAIKNIKNKNNQYFYIGVLVWVSVMFIISRIPQVVFPVRAGRDMIYPLTILAGSGIVGVWQEKNKIIKTIFIVIMLIIFARWGLLDIKFKLEKMAGQSNMMRYTQIDEEINLSIPKNAKVAVYAMNQYYPFFRNPELTANFVPTFPANAINYQDFDYLIVEVLDDGIYTWAKIDNTYFSSIDNLLLVDKKVDNFKQVYLYKVVK